MASAAIEVSSRIRLSNPKPSHCVACFAAADEQMRFVDFDCAFDGGVVKTIDQNVVLESVDDLHLCEACVRGAMEALALKPVLQRNQLREIRRLELVNEALRAQVEALRSAVAAEPRQVAA